MMSAGVIKRPFLGQMVPLGAFYDARADIFTSRCALQCLPPADGLVQRDLMTESWRLISQDTYRAKFDAFGLNAEIGASILAGWIPLEGAGRYLMDPKESGDVAKASLQQDIHTRLEKLNLSSHAIRDILALHDARSTFATHIVTEITWGCKTIITARCVTPERASRDQIEVALAAELEKLKLELSNKPENPFRAQPPESTNWFNITIHGDIVETRDSPPVQFSSACKMLREVPAIIASLNSGKGLPQVYTLLPLEALSYILPLEIATSIPMPSISAECLQDFVHLFDQYNKAQDLLAEHLSSSQAHGYCLPSNHRDIILHLADMARAQAATLRTEFSTYLRDVRSGRSTPQYMWSLLEKSRSSTLAPDKLISETAHYKDKVQFVQQLEARGVEYIGFNGKSLEQELQGSLAPKTYVFHFNEAVRRPTELWLRNVQIFQDLVSAEDTRLLLLDCDAAGIALERPKISLYRGNQMITGDVLEQDEQTTSKQEHVATRCFIKYSDNQLDRGEPTAPLETSAVRLPCPNRTCKSANAHDWVCSKCNVVVQYGHNDHYLYCACGRCIYHGWAFKCSDPNHGPQFANYESDSLFLLLEALKSFEDLNVLILGGTGVGKSTWINAFINYLVYDSLDDAINADELLCIIPSAFSTQVVDGVGRFQTKRVEIGFERPLERRTSVTGPPQRRFTKLDDSEHDGSKGQSATQRTTVHRFTVGNLLVRLIDTPGIGDTRGIEQDKKNVADILEVLRAYPQVHGILLLLKPNTPRLDLTFRFCVQELLTNLHKNAATNMAFGFTHTRGSNYKPGDTFGVLETLLQRYYDANIELTNNNVYCFDSESFRYMAAYRLDIDLGNLEDNRRSWEYSVKESRRLIEHFRSLKPHEVRSTLNLNEVRHRVSQLTKPMAQISKAIQSSILLQKQDVMELQQKNMTNEELQKKTKAKVKTPESHPVDMPRTVCTDRTCVEHYDDGQKGFDGKPTLVPIYKSICHDDCRLKKVTPELIGDNALRRCAAFRGGKSEYCVECAHFWQKHTHITFEIKWGTKTVEDQSVIALIKSNVSVAEKKAKLIESRETLIDELQAEHDQIGDATAQFTIFLKRNAIATWNDATLEYLDLQIDEEKMKIAVGGSRDTFKQLKKYRAQYEENFKILEQHEKKGEMHRLLDQAGIEPLIEKLYGLKHYGEAMQQMREVEEKTSLAPYRERPHFAQSASQWHVGQGQGQQHRNGAQGGHAQAAAAAAAAATAINPGVPAVQQAGPSSGSRCGGRFVNRPMPTLSGAPTYEPAVPATQPVNDTVAVDLAVEGQGIDVFCPPSQQAWPVSQVNVVAIGTQQPQKKSLLRRLLG